MSETRAFGCSKCGSKKWTVLRTKTYDREEGDDRYDYREWLECAKCGRKQSNERNLKHYVGSGSGSGCFPKGTQILMKNNMTTCISSLKKGDLVITTRDNNEIQIEKILKTKMYKNKQLWEITFTDGKVLKTTHSHSFFDGINWLKASKISSGDSIYFYDNGSFKKKKVDQSTMLPVAEDVYNIIVDKNYNFIANGVLSHSFTHYREYRKIYWSVFSNLKSISFTLLTLSPKNC